LLLAQGTPMVLAGDEFARTQQGNNNAYCQDNEISWVNWKNAEKNRDLINFVQRLIAIRNAYPVFHRTRFLTGASHPQLGVKDVTWIFSSGAEMQQQNWQDSSVRCFGMLIDGRAQPNGVPGSDATILLIMNGSENDTPFTLPNTPDAKRWMLLLDSSLLERGTAAVDREYFAPGQVFNVVARSFLALALEKTHNGGLTDSRPKDAGQPLPIAEPAPA